MKDLKMATLALAAAFLAVPCIALAQSPQQPDTNQNLQLMSADATLDHAVKTDKAMQGQLISAKLHEAVKTASGIELPSGTELIGHIDSVQAAQNGGPAKLALCFDKARMKGGKVIPVKVTLLNVSGPAVPYMGSSSSMADLPQHAVAADRKTDQEPGILSGISMHSSVQAANSGVLMSRDHNFTLARGTQLEVAVASLQTNGQGVAGGGQ